MIAILFILPAKTEPFCVILSETITAMLLEPLREVGNCFPQLCSTVLPTWGIELSKLSAKPLNELSVDPLSVRPFGSPKRHRVAHKCLA